MRGEIEWLKRKSMAVWIGAEIVPIYHLKVLVIKRVNAATKGRYLMAKYTQGETQLARFMAKVNISESGCWEWIGHLDKKGYAKFDHDYGGRAARYAYATLKAPIPQGFTIDHLCRNRKCVNPEHLEAVTNKENVLRGAGLTAQHAKATHCPKGHPYDSVNTYPHPKGRGCLICRRETSSKYNQHIKVLATIDGGENGS